MVASELIEFALANYETTNETIFLKVEAAIEYAEKYQSKQNRYYYSHEIPPKTQEAIMLLTQYLNEATLNDSIWNSIHSLLRFNIK